MRVNPQEQPWARRLTTEVGQRLRAERTRQGLSAQDIAERTRLLGHEVKRALIADMENGRRPVLPLADVLVLSAALNVPPLMLLLPPLAEHDVEVLPGQFVGSSDAIDWFDGSSPLGTGAMPWSNSLDDDGDHSDWLDSARPLVRRAEYRALVAELRASYRKLSKLIDDANAATGAAKRFYIDRLEAPAMELHDLQVDVAIAAELAQEQGFVLPSVDLPGDAVWNRLRDLRESVQASESRRRDEVG